MVTDGYCLLLVVDIHYRSLLLVATFSMNEWCFINSIRDRFEQPRFKVFGQVEQLLLKSIRKDDIVDETETLNANFKDDYDPNSLIAEIKLLPVICGESNQSTLEILLRSFNLCPMKNVNDLETLLVLS